MRSFLASLRTLILPFGAPSTGRRIVLDGVNGQILMYDENNLVVLSINSADGVLEVAGSAGSKVSLDPSGFSGNVAVVSMIPPDVAAHVIGGGSLFAYDLGAPDHTLLSRLVSPNIDSLHTAVIDLLAENLGGTDARFHVYRADPSTGLQDGLLNIDLDGIVNILAVLNVGGSAAVIDGSTGDITGDGTLNMATDVMVNGESLRFHKGSFDVTTAGDAKATITHGAGFTPTDVLVINNRLDNFSPGVSWWSAITGTYTGTTFRAQFRDSTGGAVVSSRVVGRFIAFG